MALIWTTLRESILLVDQRRGSKVVVRRMPLISEGYHNEAGGQSLGVSGPPALLRKPDLQNPAASL